MLGFCGIFVKGRFGACYYLPSSNCRGTDAEDTPIGFRVQGSRVGTALLHDEEPCVRWNCGAFIS